MESIALLASIGLFAFLFYQNGTSDCNDCHMTSLIFPGVAAGLYFLLIIFQLTFLSFISNKRKGNKKPYSRLDQGCSVAFLVPMGVFYVGLFVESLLWPCLFGLTIIYGYVVSCNLIIVGAASAVIYHVVLLGLVIKGIVNIQKAKREDVERGELDSRPLIDMNV